MAKRGLGRGLGSLIPSLTSDHLEFQEISIAKIGPNRNQPRRQFDPEALAELAESIAKHGIVQPVVVRPTERGYELIAGERRWRAAKEAGLAAIPALVKQSDDGESLQIALVENIQREDLNALEEAAAYKGLVDELGLTQVELAEVIGKSRATVANTLRLLNLTEEVKQMVRAEGLSSGHARALLALENGGEQVKLGRRIMAEGLSVRQAEELVKVWRLAREKTGMKKRMLTPEIRAVTRKIARSLGVKVKAKFVGDKIKIEIELDSPDDLYRLEERLS